MSEITPALTPSEWSAADIFKGGLVADGDYYAIEHNTLHISYSKEYGRVFDASELPRLIALANAALPDGDPRKITRVHVDALEDAFMKLHGPKMDAPRNDTERGLLRLSEILTSLLP